jgi:rRNA maturation protein Nop10
VLCLPQSRRGEGVVSSRRAGPHARAHRAAGAEAATWRARIVMSGTRQTRLARVWDRGGSESRPSAHWTALPRGARRQDGLAGAVNETTLIGRCCWCGSPTRSARPATRTRRDHYGRARYARCHHTAACSLQPMGSLVGFLCAAFGSLVFSCAARHAARAGAAPVVWGDARASGIAAAAIGRVPKSRSLSRSRR